MTPSSSLSLKGDTLPRPVAEHGTSIALGRPLAHPDQGDDEPRDEPDTRSASPHHQVPLRPDLNGLADSFASTNLAVSSPPLPPLPATSSPYPLLPDIPSSSAARAAPGTPLPADDEVEALVDPSEQAALSSTRKSSLTPSEEALLLPGVRSSAAATAAARRRPSVDGQSVASGTSGRSAQSGTHSFATAKNYFPLVQKRPTASGSMTAAPGGATAADPWGAPASLGAARASPAGSPAPETPPPLRQAHRRPSGSSSLASPARPTSVFPTIKPSRSASSSVFPLRSPPPSSTAAAADSPSARSSDAGSLRSESLLGAPASPPPSILARPTPSPARSGGSPSLFSRPDSSLYAPSLAPSRRSNETTATTATSRRALAKPSYASSRAPSHAEAFLASAPEPLPGPPSIFLNPTPQARSVKELLPHPKRRLSAFFGGGGGGSASSKAKAPAASSSPAASQAGPGRGKSASILDAALASSATWAAHRGEQWRAPASSSASASGGGSGGGFGPPAGYRPAHQVRRQQEEAAARLAALGEGEGEGERAPGAASPGGPTMGGGGEVPVSGEAIAEAFTRNQGRGALGAAGGGEGAGAGAEGAGRGGGAGLERTRSGVSMASVAGIDEPASASGRGAFPVRREAFPTRARAQGGPVHE